MLVRLRSALAGRYAVDRELGQGGSAVVYLAHDLRHSRPVAIKVLRPELAAIMGAERFLREIETVARLQHPHILPLYDSGEAAGLLYFVMPYVSGESLRDLLDREKQLPVDRAVAIAKDVASALAFAHNEGIIHRDIKPENILLFGGAAVVSDFGIARAIKVAGAERITDTNLVPGTPLYMSPEQTAGSDLDGRSDIYSLGIVLYEMLGGQAPFTGVSPVEVMVHQLHDAPRPLGALRKSLPSHLTAAIDKALRKNPSERFATVTEFAQAIGIPSGDLYRPARPGRRRAMIAAALLGITALSAAGLVAWARWPNVDEALHVVLPFEADSTAVPPGAAQRTDMLVYQSLDHLRGVKVLDPMKTRDAWDRSVEKQGIRKMVSAAQRSGAGNAVWGDIAPAGPDSILIRAALYRIGRDAEEIRTASVMVATRPAGAGDAARAVASLAAKLMLPTAAPNLPPERWLGTDTLAALDAFARGYAAMQQGRLDAARAEFRAAIDADPAYAQAHLWLAQTEMWVRQRGTAWRSSARLAYGMVGRLTSHTDSAYARALRAVADSLYREACDEYRGLLARDPSDPVAWYGLGECLRYDDVVVANPASPSGWWFRSSFEDAMRAYRHAFQLAPSLNYAFGTQVYGRAAGAMYASPGGMRLGRHENGDTVVFGAFPGLDADTFSFVPWPIADAVHGRNVPASHDAAVEHARRELREIATQWASAYAASADAHAALAEVYEREGLLTGDPSALAEIARARRLPAARPDSIRFLVDHVRMLVRAGAAAAARVIADSGMAAWPDPSPADAEKLAALAALRGRVRLAADYQARTASMPVFDILVGRRIQVASDLAEAAQRFTAFAAFGAPADSLAHYERLARDLIARQYPRAADREHMRYVLLGNGGAFSFFELGAAAVPEIRETDYLAPILLDLAAGRRARARAALDSVQDRNAPAGEQSILLTYHEARAYLSLGDSAAAWRHLAPVVEALALTTAPVLDDVLHPAAIVRAHALYAALALRAGNRAAARRAAALVTTLWDGADDAVQPVVNEARRIARGP